jgi:hypothetical protein
VPALVQQALDRPVFLPDHDHPVRADVGVEEVAGLRDLLLGAQQYPGAAEYPVQLQAVDRLVGVDPRAQYTLVHVAQGAEIIGTQLGVAHGGGPPVEGAHGCASAHRRRPTELNKGVLIP